MELERKLWNQVRSMTFRHSRLLALVVGIFFCSSHSSHAGPLVEVALPKTATVKLKDGQTYSGVRLLRLNRHSVTIYKGQEQELAFAKTEQIVFVDDYLLRKRTIDKGLVRGFPLWNVIPSNDYKYVEWERFGYLRNEALAGKSEDCSLTRVSLAASELQISSHGSSVLFSWDKLPAAARASLMKLDIDRTVIFVSAISFRNAGMLVINYTTCSQGID